MVYENRWGACVVDKDNRLEPKNYKSQDGYTDDRSSEPEAIMGSADQLMRTQTVLLAPEPYMGYYAPYHSERN
jgi:hypothetical protein